LELQTKKVNARTICWQLSELGNSTKILLPSSGKISNVSTKIFASIFREIFKSEHFKIQIWGKIPEDGNKNCSRKPWYQKLSLDGASFHFVGL